MGLLFKRPIEKSISIACYTKKMIDVCYWNESEEDRETFLMWSDFEKLEQAEEIFQRKINKVRRVVLDEQLLVWLDKNRLENTPENRSRYVSSISDEEAMKSWKKNKFHKATIPLLLPVSITGNGNVPSNETPINKRIVKEVQKLVAKSYKVSLSDVWVYPAITRADVWNQDEDFRLFAFLDAYFSNKESRYETPKVLVEQNKVDLDIQFIPIGVQYHRKMIISRKELENEMDPVSLDSASKRLSDFIQDNLKIGRLTYQVSPFFPFINEALEFRNEMIKVRKNPG